MDKMNSTTFMKRILGYSMASWVNCLISIIATPLITALFLPEELGKINLFLSYANILIPLIYLGFDQAYVRFFNEPCGNNDSRSLLKLCMTISFIMTGIVAVGIMFTWRYFSFNIVGYDSILVSLCLIAYLAATMVFRYVNLTSRMDNKIWPFFFQSVVSTIIIKISFVLVALVKSDATYAIVLRSFLLLVAATVFLLFTIKQKNRRKVDYQKSVVFELSKFAIPLFPTVFLIMLNSSLAQILLKKYVNYAVVGIYSNALMIAGLITIVQSGLNTFWTPFVYEYYKDQKKIQTMHHVISFLMMGTAFGILMFQNLIYYVLVNSNYWESKKVITLLLVAPVCETISETLGLGIELSKKTYLKMPVYIVNITVNVLACLMLLPRYGILGAAIANAAASLSMMIAKAIIGERLYKCSDTYIRLIISMIMLITFGFINYFFNGGYENYIMAAVGILILILLYRKEAILVIRNGKSFLMSITRKKVT